MNRRTGASSPISASSDLWDSFLQDLDSLAEDGPFASGATKAFILPDETRPWDTWLRQEFPEYVTAPFAPHHIGLWEWIEALVPGIRPRPKVDIWSRGGAKSSTVELGCARVGRKLSRWFGLYVSKTQDMSDRHVQAIAGMFERLRIDRALNEYGYSKGWTRQLLRTAHGFNLLAIGLDKGVRGVKLDELRPDFIVLDDVDDRHDTPAAVQKKIELITENILPAGSPDCAVLFVQNLIHNKSIASMLADGTAEFLLSRLPVVKEPAILDLTYELRHRDDGTPYYAITGGKPTWEGQNLAISEAQINDWGLTAFLREAQHEVEDPDGGMYSHLVYRRCAAEDVPPLARVAVWCDPAVTETDDSDSHGIQCDGLGENSVLYRLVSWEQRTSPLDVLCRAFVIAIERGAECVGVETDQGGDTWHSVYNEAWRTLTMDEADLPADLDPRITAHRARLEALRASGKRVYQPPFRSAKAGSSGMSKAARGAQMLADYERGRIVHVLGTHIVLERGLRRFPKAKPFDLHDAAFWSWHYLTGGGMSNSAVGAFG
jgi:hypothetical protein